MVEIFDILDEHSNLSKSQIEKLLQLICNEKSISYQSGYDKGKDEGYDIGYQKGLDNPSYY